MDSAAWFDGASALVGPALVGGSIGVVALLAGGVGVGVLIARARRAPNEVPPGDVPAAVQRALQRLDVLRGVYLARERYPVAARTARTLGEVVGSVGALFRQAARTGGDVARLEHEYVPALGRLAIALDHGYLLDMVERPDAWGDADRRVAEVEQALGDLTQRALDDAKDLLMRRAIRAEISLDGLSERAELRAWERAFDDADDA